MAETEAGTLLDEINAQVPAADFELEYFPGGMVRVTIELTAEMVSQVRALAGEHGWPEDEAFVTVLASGIGAFEEARVRAPQESAGGAAEDEQALLASRLREMEMRYAVMKHRSWEFLKAYQSASLSDGAMRTQLTGLNHLVERLRAENDALRAENQQLRATGALPSAAEPAAPPAGSNGADKQTRDLGQRVRNLLRSK